MKFKLRIHVLWCLCVQALFCCAVFGAQLSFQRCADALVATGCTVQSAKEESAETVIRVTDAKNRHFRIAIKICASKEEALAKVEAGMGMAASIKALNREEDNLALFVWNTVHAQKGSVYFTIESKSGRQEESLKAIYEIVHASLPQP